MKEDLKKYQTKLVPAIALVKRYAVIIVIALVVGVFGFLVYRIGNLANAEPNQTAVDDALAKVTRPRIDPNAIKALQDLQSQNVNIQSLFPTDRNNPFQE